MRLPLPHLITFLAITFCISKVSNAQNQPNILLVISDDLGVDYTNGYHQGALMPTTPTLDSLRTVGVTFENAFATPKCATSRAAIMSGKYGIINGVTSVPGVLDPVHTSIFKELATQTNDAYSNAVVGKWHIGGNNLDHPADHGVDFFSGSSGNLADYYDWVKTVNGVSSQETIYATTDFTNTSIDWINNQSTPWFLWLAHCAPHGPFHVPPRDLFHINGTNADRRKYIAMIEAMDTEMGRMFASMSAAERDNTVVIYVGDNGTPNQVLQDYPAQHGKNSMYQGGIRVPMIVGGGPVSRKGEREAALVHFVDIYSTILELAGADLPGGIYNSLSFKNLLEHAPQSTRDYNYSEIDGETRNGYTIRGEQYKVIKFTDNTEEMYDLLNDSLEVNDLLLGTLTPEQLDIKSDLEAEALQIRTGSSCRDNIQNGNETGIDEGGSCDPCDPNSSAISNPAITNWLQNTTAMGSYYFEGNSTPIPQNILANCQKIEYSNDWVYVTTNGIPTYPTGPYLDRRQNNVTAESQTGIWRFPLNPQQNTGAPDNTTGGNIGLFVNGVALFDYRDGVGWNTAENALCGGPANPACPRGVPWTRDAIPAEMLGFDCAKGHPANGNYHHHQNPSAFKLDQNVLVDICNLYDSEGLYVIDSTKHSPLIGFAYDGFPIYGAYGYKNADGTGGIVRIKSGYQLRNITQRTHHADGSNVDDGPPVDNEFFLGYFREDYEWITHFGEDDYLNENNGRFCVTPEYPNGTFAYFATVDELWNSAYPYVVGPNFYGSPIAGRVTSITETTSIHVQVDNDGDGFYEGIDCDDNNPNIYPGATEIPNNNIDEDCDCEALIIDDDMDGFNSDEDCDDTNAAINPNATEVPNNNVDEDCDGVAQIIDEDMDGFNSDEDCDDTNAAINPNATEIPNNNVDENCDGIIEFIDEDMDGFNSDEDCDDTNAAINPNATEIPNNNIDEDCDGIAQIIDEDMDGFNSDEDCDDTNAAINPNATEIPNNTIDEDCDGIAQIIDEDMDGFNSDEDCDDTNADINPNATEIPNNGIDEDCDGFDTVIDNDMDGFNSDEDCDDNNANINPGATEIPNNSIDEDCDGIAQIIDEDMDGFNSDEDCDDTNAAINPNATEVPNNNVDEDCDGIAQIIDADMDGYNSDEDCDESNPNINPGATEIPNNGIDEDCDGFDAIVDLDMDGFNSDVDCDDSNPNINPDATEIANNNIDENCDGIILIIDEDMDGFNSDEDCDDTNAAINPNATEVPNNTIDEDCDGVALIIDEDMDGFNSDEDCDDTNAAINPNATEIPNNTIDEDCDGITLIIDDDMDGFNSDEDCDDTNAAINPNATEIPNNSIDEDCDGVALIIDDDMDGFNSDEDCDDTNAAINPNATEIPNNSIDEDCDGTALIIDDDMDGFNSDEDCDDTNAAINPNATEIPNNTIDEDCDGVALIIDDDMDGFNSDEDCDDTNADINPGATEIPDNGIDENCDGMDATSGLNEINGRTIKLFPNPASDFISIQIDGLNTRELEVKVYDLTGKLMATSKVYQGSTMCHIETHTFYAGEYFAHISDGGRMGVVKFVVVKD